MSYFVFEVVIKDFAGCDKKIFDVFPCFGRRFKVELDAFFSLECLDALMGNFSLVFHVFLVAHQHDYDGRLALGHDLVVPGGEVLEGVQSSDVVS